jgi:hypothetical protein
VKCAAEQFRDNFPVVRTDDTLSRRVHADHASMGRSNDEIHNNFLEQHTFEVWRPTRAEAGTEGGSDGFFGSWEFAF